MKLAIAAAAVVTAAIATTGSAATGSAATSLARPAAAACSTQKTTVKGHTAYIFCGPATGTLSVGGTTYSFHGGTCIKGSTLIVAIGAASPDSEFAAALFPPWWRANRAFEAAASAGAGVGVGLWPSILIVRGRTEDLSARLRAAGAVLVVQAGAFVPCRIPGEGVTP